MKDKINKELRKELLDIQQKFEALKSSHNITVSELNSAKEWSETLLSSLPYPAMYTREKDRVIVAVNKVASDMGVKIGGYCWREFMKAEHLSQKDKEIAAKYPDAVPAEFNMRCSFCLSDKCFSDSQVQIDHEMHAFGLIWETYWIKVSDEVFLHYAINITENKQAEKELLASENRNREIIENSQAGYFYINHEGLYQKVNATWLNLHKYDNADEVIGKHFGITQVDMDLKSAKKIVEEILKGDQIPSGEFSRLCKDGSIAYHNFSCNKVLKDEKVIGLEGFLIDTTERKKAEEKLLFINKAIESSSNAIGISDSHGRHFYQNKALSDLFGYATAEEMEAAGGANIAVKDPKVAKELFSMLMSGNPWSGELDMVTKNGNVFPAYEYADAVKDSEGNILGVVGVITDISERKRAELELKENEEKLVQLNLDKDRFISILGHDLRSPFNNLLGLSELLSKNIHKYDIDKIEKLANGINKSARNTNNLLDDLLKWAMAQQGNIPFNPENVSLTDVCNDVLITLNPIADAKTIVINCLAKDHLNVFADNDMLKTVLRNLVSNAIKFTNNGGAISINAEQADSKVTISVSDNGVGIPPENLSKLYNISEVLTTKGTAKETGTGLGLLICKEFVEKHGGVIWVESEVGKGSEFRFTLPFDNNGSSKNN
jgi:PAS domain S-box-containing protein